MGYIMDAITDLQISVSYFLEKIFYENNSENFLSRFILDI